MFLKGKGNRIWSDLESCFLEWTTTLTPRAIDLSQAIIADKDEESKTATITLPLPKVVSARVDHERTKNGGIKGVRFALLRNPKNRTKIVDDAMQEAQAVVEKAAGRPEIIESAQKQARLNIQMLYLKVGWNVGIHWQESFDLPK